VSIKYTQICGFFTPKNVVNDTCSTDLNLQLFK